MSTEATEALFAQLKHLNPHLRDQAMVEIVETRDESTIPRLMRILDDEDTTYRRAAVKTLGVVGMDAVPAIVEAMLHSENVTVRGSCAKALAQVAVNYPDQSFPEVGLAGLKQALRDDNPVVNIGAAMALGEIGASAVEILIEGFWALSENVGIQVAIVNALASAGGDRAMETLTNLSTNDTVDTYVRESATSALSRLELVMKNQRS
jgi:bilin biosynthesis protein